MTKQQTYARRSNAKRAALADLGKDVVEDRDYQITKGQDGRYSYQCVVRATKLDTGANPSPHVQPKPGGGIGLPPALAHKAGWHVQRNSRRSS